MTVSYGFSQSGSGSIRGTIKDATSKAPIEGAKVILRSGTEVKGKTITDENGKFQFDAVLIGTYDVETSNTAEEYQGRIEKGVPVSESQITFLDKLELSKTDSKEIDEVKVTAYRVPLIKQDGGASGGTITRDDISRLAVRSATDVASTVGGVSKDEGSGNISIRGAREDASYFFIDGIKVRGSSNLPKSAIEEVTVITGGVPANYGDVTGGIISITTRGPSSKYFGSIEAVTSGFYFKGKDESGYDGKVIGFDKFSYNLIEGMFSGPLLFKKDSTGKKTKPLLGFLISGNFTSELDSRPQADGSYRVKKETRDALIANPLRPLSTGDGTTYNVNFLQASDFEKTKWRMNARSTSGSASGKIDVNAGPTINLTFGGSLNYGSGKIAGDRTNSLLNFTNFGTSNSLDWRVYGRFTQRFAAEKKEGVKSIFKGAYYSLMIDYSKSKNSSYDSNNKYNLFGYGHVGKFVTSRERSYGANAAGDSILQTGFRDTKVDFTPATTNDALSSVTSQYFDIFSGSPFGRFENLNQIQGGGALLNGQVPPDVYGLWNNLGTPYNGFAKSETNQFRVTAQGAANIGDHSISLGFEFEQRTDRSWGSGNGGPIGLWSNARLLANSHIKELDFSQYTTEYYGTFPRLSYERLNTGYAYTSGTGKFGGIDKKDNQSFFDYNLRQKLGLDVAGTDFINIDEVDPALLDIGMFSPDELFTSATGNLVQYNGYDITGKKVRGATDVDKYFNEIDANGNYKRFIGAFQPTYTAGYIMDKFAFNDLIFNVGLRVDAFDANQPVLKDPYLMNEAKTAGEVRKLKESNPTAYSWINVPSSIGDDYVVYVNDFDAPSAINGYRKGNQWYSNEGTELENANSVRGGKGIQPWLQEPSKTSTSSKAFEDYKPQINVMPRVAFSFPVSEKSSFFAHYDVLTKRPTSGVRFDAIDYQLIQLRSDIINNPNLKPETTIDYEIGFQQVLGRTSSIKVSAFYKEQRNNVQLIQIADAYPVTYRTFGNRDFGTIKGLTIAYDLRRTGNFRSTVAYTLQFAEGTGSDATSANAIISSGKPNLKVPFALDFDRRHTFAITADYRYGEGTDYNGPTIKGKQILKNTGLNIVSNIYSGSPYSRQIKATDAASINPATPSTDGSLNGSRLPWSYRLDLQLDKNFELKFGSKEGGKKQKNVFCNVYIRATNLFNNFNVLNVYRATGNATDDGYLEAAGQQASIQSKQDEQSFRNYYQMKVNNPYNLSVPRTIRLGVKFDF
jgi:outer membrane receptor protein involved in Fe transport